MDLPLMGKKKSEKKDYLEITWATHESNLCQGENSQYKNLWMPVRLKHSFLALKDKFLCMSTSWISPNGLNI